jgi:hypothetical protein
MNILPAGLTFMGVAFTVVMAIPIVGPHLLAAFA